MKLVWMGVFDSQRCPRARALSIENRHYNIHMNRLAAYSLIAALLTILSFCIGFAPFLPLTALVCYPAAVILGIISLVTGFRALRQMRISGESGRWMALAGIWVGSFAILAVLCATTLTLATLLLSADYLQTLRPTPLP